MKYVTKISKFTKNINSLTAFHYSKCKDYKNILDNGGYKFKKKYQLKELPFVPVRIFKYLDLMSVKKKEILKILNSSGTSSDNPSKIFLDRKNALNQRIVLNKLFKNHVSTERLPMMVIGKKIKLQKNKFDAKTTAILGFANFAKSISYVLNENDNIDYDEISTFLNKNKNKKFLIFGFTSEIYEFFKKISKSKNLYKFYNGILLHGGGWKKLEKIEVTDQVFNNFLKSNFKIKNIINYYGLIEQVGSIFFECQKCNNFICSDYSDVFIRDKDLKIKESGIGFVQLISTLPTSYPGHNILTEDIGEIINQHKNSCKHKGKIFKIYGRAKRSEVRGCSNV